MELDCTQKVRQGVLDRIIDNMPISGHQMKYRLRLRYLVSALSDIICKAILDLKDYVNFGAESRACKKVSPLLSEFLQACTDVYNRCVFDLYDIQDIMQMLAERRAILKDAK